MEEILFPGEGKTLNKTFLYKIEVSQCRSRLMQIMTSLLTSTSEPSICIPRVFSNVDKTCVKDVFEELFGEGCVERIDMIQKTAGNLEKFQRVFVHFKYWPVTHRNQQVRQRLIDGHQIKIVYNDPWFWKCSASRIPKPKDKVNYPSVDGLGETYNSEGEKKGGRERRERIGKLQCSKERKNREIAMQQGLMLFDSPQDFGETTEDATGEDATGEDATGEDDKTSGTGWRQVNKRTRGKKNKRGNNSAGYSLREAQTQDG